MGFLTAEELLWVKELFRKIDFLQFVPEEDLKELAANMLRLTYHANQTVIFQGEISSRLYILHKGKISVFVRDKGEKKKVAELMPGDYFGEISLVEPSTANATVRTDEPCIIYVITNEVFEKVIQKHPEALASIKQKIAERKAKLSGAG